MAHDSDSGWTLGSFSVPNAIPQTALAVTTTEDEGIHVYYGGSTIACWRKSTMLTQVGMTAASAQSSIPGSLVAAISWGTGSGLNICVSFQQAISEVSQYQWVYSVCVAWIDQKC
ncbi:hypothetical protein IFM46972_08338 [Aspergillus udagawae]|uniref:Fucose-specific lectin n=1 Tax=Aspergillus udagawae TaxID=91492 RepID=A0A8H3S093_9EURO|nr:hypothetical protein IFM46972_08338 [Aspergillus udagawae]